MPKDTLNEQQKTFCEYYVDLNHATNSAIRAGYSKKTAHVQGSKLLKIPKIKAYLAELREERKVYMYNRFASNAKTALDTMEAIIQDPDSDSELQFKVAKDFLDRAGFKATDKQEVDHKGDIKVSFNIPRPKYKK